MWATTRDLLHSILAPEMPVTSQAGMRKFLAWGKTKFNATFIDEDTLPVQQGTCSLASIQCCVCCISVFSCLLLCCSIHQRWATNPFMMLMFAALELIIHTSLRTSPTWIGWLRSQNSRERRQQPGQAAPQCLTKCNHKLKVLSTNPGADQACILRGKDPICSDEYKACVTAGQNYTTHMVSGWCKHIVR